MTTADVAIIGLGAMGSSAAWHLARRGKKVVAFEQFELGHAKGSSHGRSRIFRVAYAEGAAYVPLALRALDNWRLLERESGQEILTLTGILEAGAPGSPMVEGALQSARKFQLAYEILDADAIHKRFPAFRLPRDWRGIVQPQAGFLRPERAIRVCCELARKHGASLRENQRVDAIEPRDDGVRVVTETGEAIAARSVIVAAGAWIADLAPLLKPHVTVTRQVAAWLAPPAPDLFTPARFPVFVFDCGHDSIYGIADFEGGGVKVAEHWSGEAIAHADTLRRAVAPHEADAIRALAKPFFNRTLGATLDAQACMYTRTRDEDFIIDRHPEEPRIILTSPCSGHGFKFASVIGEALADLATDGDTSIDIGMFSMKRLAAEA